MMGSIWGESLHSRFPALSGPAAAVQAVWEDDDLTSCLFAIFFFHLNEWGDCFQYILHVCCRQSFFVSCPKSPSFTSFGGLDLYFTAHWPAYYDKWGGNNISWTAGSTCNLLHICPFHSGHAGQRFSSSPLLSEGRRFVYSSASNQISYFLWWVLIPSIVLLMSSWFVIM